MKPSDHPVERLIEAGKRVFGNARPIGCASLHDADEVELDVKVLDGLPTAFRAAEAWLKEQRSTQKMPTKTYDEGYSRGYEAGHNEVVDKQRSIAKTELLDLRAWVEEETVEARDHGLTGVDVCARMRDAIDRQIKKLEDKG